MSDTVPRDDRAADVVTIVRLVNLEPLRMPDDVWHRIEAALAREAAAS